MLTSYHVHTIRSDGESPARDFVDEAVQLGLDELGFSDHYVLLPAGTSASWSMPLTDISAYIGEIDALREQARDSLVVRCGIEADFEPDTVADLRDVLNSYPFDYVIGSVHFVDGFPVDECKEKWDVISQSDRNDIVRGYLDRIAQMARSGVFDFVGHLDLYKKFGYLPTVDISADMSLALDAIAAARMPIEINTSGLVKEIREIYPSEAVLRECRNRSIPVLITADAHRPEHLTRGYAEAVDLVERVGYDQVGVYENRRLGFSPLEALAKQLS